MAMPTSLTPPSRYSESDGATVVNDHTHLRPVAVASGSKRPSFHKQTGKPVAAPLEDVEALPFVDETAYLDVKR